MCLGKLPGILCELAAINIMTLRQVVRINLIMFNDKKERVKVLKAVLQPFFQKSLTLVCYCLQVVADYVSHLHDELKFDVIVVNDNVGIVTFA